MMVSETQRGDSMMKQVISEPRCFESEIRIVISEEIKVIVERKTSRAVIVPLAIFDCRPGGI